jgi:hypothetical protein
MMAFTKKDVQTQLEGLVAQEKQLWAQLNYVLGQKSVLDAMAKEMPDDPTPEPTAEAVAPAPVEVPASLPLPEPPAPEAGPLDGMPA